MIYRARHLQDDRLFECYLAERHGEPMDLPAAEHLADCGPCGSRYADLATFMEALRRDGEAEADAVFTPDWLKTQQQQIAHRLEHVGRPARVISFPEPSARRAMTASVSRTAPRWVAAAAAAGLFVGVALTASYEWGSQARAARQRIALDAATPRPRVTPAVGRVESNAADEAFLSELEFALERPHTRELLAFDALTPHVREVSVK
ncbi:MAG: hypothetical protein A3F69_03245 [Acidobacteria bacterium RIFCSPLOWO2_12_FULL_66_10]|nr:MAG: hypothetical protein A3F69_03245 [Acidobacteria bacterium RIFCSPLOWO2_12_FULL_66_10]